MGGLWPTCPLATTRPDGCTAMQVVGAVWPEKKRCVFHLGWVTAISVATGYSSSPEEGSTKMLLA